MSGRNPGIEYAAALDRCKKAELEMRRAFRRLYKYRAALLRCEKRLDAAMRVIDEAPA